MPERPPRAATATRRASRGVSGAVRASAMTSAQSLRFASKGPGSARRVPRATRTVSGYRLRAPSQSAWMPGRPTPATAVSRCRARPEAMAEGPRSRHEPSQSVPTMGDRAPLLTIAASVPSRVRPEPLADLEPREPRARKPRRCRAQKEERVIGPDCSDRSPSVTFLNDSTHVGGADGTRSRPRNVARRRARMWRRSPMQAHPRP